MFDTELMKPMNAGGDLTDETSVLRPGFETLG